MFLLIFRELPNHTMPVILVATDFSPAGSNAAYYAASLAQSWNCELTLLHSYFMPVTFNDPAIPIIPVAGLQEANNDRMNKAAQGLQAAFPILKINTRLEYGDIEDIIEEVIEEVKPQLLVIGSHGEEEDSFWSGSRSGELLRSSKTAILAVPEGFAYKPVQKVCIAVDQAGMPEDGAFESLQTFLKLNKAGLDILHVVKADATAPEDQSTVPIPAFDAGIPVSFNLVMASGNVDDELAAFTQNNAADWLAVIPHHYSFWESLFHKSHTKAMVHKTGIPLLALH